MMRPASIASAALLIGAALAQQTSSDSNVTIRSSVREVLLEVVVRDARGRLVTKIDPKQVSVYEDGVRQDIRSFHLVSGREVRVQDEQQMARAALSQNGSRRDIRAAINPLRTVNIVCLILNDLSADTRAFAFDAARKFVDKELRPDTFIGVFSLDASGLRPVFPFSNNRERLMKAVQLAAVNQLPLLAESSGAMLNGLSMSTIGAPAVAGAPEGFADAVSPANPLGTRGDMGLAVNAGLREIDALVRLVRQLSPLPFEKTVLLMGTGLTIPPDQTEYWRSLLRAANQGGVTFYGLDVFGLGPCQDNPSADCASSTTLDASSDLLNKAAALSRQTIGRFPPGQAGPNNSSGAPPAGSTSGGQSTPSPSAAGQMMEMMHQSDYMRFGVLSADRQGALRDLAESTGGFLIANTNNTEKLLARVMEDVDTHFELAYRPASEKNDGHFRKIEVKLERPDLRVQTRSGYFAVPDTPEDPLTAADLAGLRALDTKPLPHFFEFESKAFRFRPGKETSQYAIAFEVPISTLTATPETDGHKHRIHASLLALVKDEQGEIVERVSKDVPSDVADEYLPALQRETMSYEHAVNLKPGNYTIETAVVDLEGNRSSANIFQVENRERPGLGLSEITLVRRVTELQRAQDIDDPFEMPGKRAQPSLSTTLPRTARPYVYFVVYPDKQSAAIPSLRAQMLKDGRVVSKQESALPHADSSGAIPMAIQPPAGPGEYEVRITVQQGRNSVQQSLKYTIAP